MSNTQGQESRMELVASLPDEVFLEVIDCDTRTVEQARKDLKSADYSYLTMFADEDAFDCVPAADECTESAGMGFCQCLEEVRDALTSLEDETLADVLDLTTIEERRNDYLRWQCLDCCAYTDDEYYMVKDKIWNSVVGADDGLLCIGCLEARLGRKLKKKDFIDAPINEDSLDLKSPRLLDRLGLEAPSPVSS